MLETHVLMLSVSAEISIIVDFAQVFESLKSFGWDLQDTYNLALKFCK